MKIKLTEAQIKMVEAYKQSLTEGHMKTAEDLNDLANSYLKYFIERDLFKGDLQQIMRYVYTMLKDNVRQLTPEDSYALFNILGDKLKNAGDQTLTNFGQQFHYIAQNMKPRNN